jgi:hypothetical protein
MGSRAALSPLSCGNHMYFTSKLLHRNRGFFLPPRDMGVLAGDSSAVRVRPRFRLACVVWP